MELWPSPRDTVLLSPGTFTGPGNRDISFRGMDLVVKSSGGPENTIIDCEYLGRGFYLDEAQTREARIEGITIWRGSAMDTPDGMGGGIYCGGGGVCFSGTGPNRLVGCTIVANAIGADGSAINSAIRIELVRCIVRGNCGEDEISCSHGGDFTCCNIDPAGLPAAGYAGCAADTPFPRESVP